MMWGCCSWSGSLACSGLESAQWFDPHHHHLMVVKSWAVWTALWGRASTEVFMLRLFHSDTEEGNADPRLAPQLHNLSPASETLTDGRKSGLHASGDHNSGNSHSSFLCLTWCSRLLRRTRRWCSRMERL